MPVRRFWPGRRRRRGRWGAVTLPPPVLTLSHAPAQPAPGRRRFNRNSRRRRRRRPSPGGAPGVTAQRRQCHHAARRRRHARHIWPRGALQRGARRSATCTAGTAPDRSMRHRRGLHNTCLHTLTQLQSRRRVSCAWRAAAAPGSWCDCYPDGQFVFGMGASVSLAANFWLHCLHVLAWTQE